MKTDAVPCVAFLSNHEGTIRLQGQCVSMASGDSHHSALSGDGQANHRILGPYGFHGRATGSLGLNLEEFD